MFVYIITFTVFPGVAFATYISSMQGMSNYMSWYILLMATTFNVFDLLGRYVGGIPKLQISPRAIVGNSVARLVFVATFLLVLF